MAEPESRRLVEQASDRRLRALVEHSADLIVLIGPDGHLTYLSPAFERVLGFRAEDWLGQRLFDLIAEGEAAHQLFARCVAAPGEVIAWQLRLRHADGSLRWLEGTAVNYFDDPFTDGVVINCRDITGRKRVEDALQASSDMLASLARQVPGVIYQYRLWPDGHSSFPFASEAIREIYEVTPDEVRDDASVVFGRLHPDDREDVARSISESASSLAPWFADYRVVLPVQGVRWRRGLARPQRVDDGSVLWHGFITDITDLKSSQEALRQKEAALESSLNGIAMSDLSGTLTYVNQAFLDLWGHRSATEVIGRPAVSFWGTAEAAADVIAQVQAHGAWTGELVAERADGEARELQVSATRFADMAGRPAGMLASFLDVTEPKRLQQQFVQAQKMESIGRLAGGVAHDFNNLLTVIKGYVGLALMSLEADHPTRADLVEIEKATASAGALTQQLLAFSRKQLIRPAVLDLNDVVVRVRTMLQRLLGEDIVLRTDMAADLGAVRFDPGQAEQVLVNLAVNARDAMPRGGTLTIETANVDLDDAYAETRAGASPGPHVLLAVSDNGCGMSDEVRAHLFEPFFTTKGPGSGTGLGLAMIYGAVTQNGGRIEAYSEVGKGTTFRIYLPRLTDRALDVIASSPVELPRGDEQVLLVEDDAQVRTLAARLLGQLGYTVVACCDGHEALAAVARPDLAVDLLITDVIMPGMNGRELAEGIRALRPQVGVLYTSGYTANVIVQHGVLPDGIEFLPKPYTVELLARRVRQVIERPR